MFQNFFNAKMIKDEKMAIIIEIMRAEDTTLYFFDKSLFVLYFETFLAVVSGNPLETKVKNKPKIEDAIWNIPKPRAPNLRDKNIRNKNPNARVMIEKIVTIATALKIFFILVLKYYIIHKKTLWLSSCNKKSKEIWDVRIYKYMDIKQSKRFYYRVKPNETMQEIMKKFNTCKSNILRNNSDLELYAGEWVIICENEFKIHCVKPIETIDSIAKLYNMEKEKIIKDNNLLTTKLFIGQQLKIFV